QEQGPVIGRPLQGRDSFGRVGKRVASPQVLDVKRILPETGRVAGIRQQILVIADRKSAQAEKRVTLCQFVQVEQDRFGGVHAALSAALDRILLTLFRA